MGFELTLPLMAVVRNRSMVDYTHCMSSRRQTSGVTLARVCLLVALLVLTAGAAWMVVQSGHRRYAVQQVTVLPEVQEYFVLVEEGGRSTPGVRLAAQPTRDEPWYLVQVYEIFADHTATFNWYRVDVATGVVTLVDLLAE